MQGASRIAFFVVLITAALGFLSWACWVLRSRISGPVERISIDFSDLRRTGRPNDYLVCPPDYCTGVPDALSPVFDVPVSRLREEWEAVISGQPRIVRIASSCDLQIEFEQRSLLLGFPDTITTCFYPLGKSRSTLAVYSRSHYGYWDLGVNSKRVRSWLGELGQRLAGPSPANR